MGVDILGLALKTVCSKYLVKKALLAMDSPCFYVLLCTSQEGYSRVEKALLGYLLVLEI